MNRAEEILKELGIVDGGSIDLVKVAAHLNVTIKERPLSGCEAMIAGIGDKAIISINSNSPSTRKRFSIAHELGHWIFDKGEAKFCSKANYTHWKIGNKEYRANDFAGNLLLPKSMLTSHTAYQKLTLQEVDTIATEFNASRMATAIRLVQLSGYPALVAYYEGGSRKWFHANRHVPREFFPHLLLQDSSIAKDVQQRGGDAEGSKLVDADAWFDRGDPEKYTVWENSVVSPYGVLSLISWPDESHIVDFNEDDEDE